MIELELRPVRIRSLISHCMNIISILAKKKCITINYQDEIGLELLITVDQERLQQVILNILSNAIKFSNAGGEIQIVSRILDKKLEIDIIDNGIGIEETHLNFIFDAFCQVKSGMKRWNEGSV